ncbi:MAG: aminopeptidase P family protein [Actinomycetales bacterium]|nr:aminopeptidase P family protein [Actinomycetales bacterium]
MSIHGVDALIVSPSPDLRYLSGYAALPLERLTALIVRAEDDPVLMVPELEVAAARAAGVSFEITSWAETEDPFALIATLLSDADVIGVDDRMWASRLFAIQEALPETSLTVGGSIIAELRMTKEPEEVAALTDAGAAIDRVHDRMHEWLRAGRTEREVGADIARAILDEGHDQVDFVIVASGPNGASPHHEVSDRVIEVGDPVVVDIGGTNKAGYCSDSTRNYVAGPEVDPEYAALHAVLLDAQTAQRAAARPGISAEQLDAVGRDIIEAAGFGPNFMHRTGHGIGLETHEEPYIVSGSVRMLKPGMAFSIEPGIYLPGRFGARIEDIFVCTDDGAVSLNNTSRELRFL